MRAFLVTPNHDEKRGEVTEIELETGADGDVRLSSLRAHLDCDVVEFVSAEGSLVGHHFAVDEEGLIKNPSGFMLFTDVLPMPLAGKIIVLLEHFDEELGFVSRPPTIDLDVFKGIVANAYCSRSVARDAILQHEAMILQNFPGAIVMGGANFVRD